MENLIRSSFSRFRKTFLRYFLVYVLGVLAITLAILATLVTGGILFLVYLILGSQPVVGTILGVLFGIGSLGMLIYLGSWIQLSQVLAVTKPELKEITECFKESRPLVLPFLGFVVLNGLFLMGLLLTNVLFFLPFILWTVWGMFSVFAFLDGHRGGLKPLWYSKAIIKGSFLKVLLYIVVAYFSLLLITGIVTQINEDLAFINSILWFLATPLLMAYSFELYKTLKAPSEVKRPTPWIVISALGWILNFLVFGSLVISVIPTMRQMVRDNKEFKLDKNIEKQLLNNLKDSKLN